MFKFVVKICLAIFGHILFRSFWPQYSFITQTFGVLNEHFFLTTSLFTLNSSAITLMPKQLSVPTRIITFSSFSSVFIVTGQSGHLLSCIFLFSFWQLVVPLNHRKSWKLVLLLRLMEKVEGVGGSFLQSHKKICVHSYSPFRALLLNYYNSNQKMYKILLKLQYY